MSKQVSAPSPDKWSNDVPTDMDEEMKTPTPREKQLAGLAEAGKGIAPKLYDITSTNPRAMRVVHDSRGYSVAIQPLATKTRVSLHPGTATYLGRTGSDLSLKYSI